MQQQNERNEYLLRLAAGEQLSQTDLRIAGVD